MTPLNSQMKIRKANQVSQTNLSVPVALQLFNPNKQYIAVDTQTLNGYTGKKHIIKQPKNRRMQKLVAVDILKGVKTTPVQKAENRRYGSRERLGLQLKG